MSISNLNPFAISCLIIAVCNLPLFFFIVISGKTKLTKIFSLHILSVALWGVGGFFLATSTDAVAASSLWRFAYSGVIFIPVFFQHAVLLLLGKKAKFYTLFIYVQALFFLAANLTDNLGGVDFVFNSFYFPKGNLLFLLSFIAWLSIVSIAHYQLIFHYRKDYPNKQRQIFFLLMAVIGFIGGTINFFVAIGIPVYPYGNFVIPLHSLAITYAILRHQLFDIKVVIQRSIVYSVLIALISIVYLTTVLLIEKLLQASFAYQSPLVSIITAFSIGILFFPLRNRIQRFVDRTFFRGTQEEIAQENVRLRKEVAESEKLRAVATLASGMAHEIKNPLTAVKTFSEYLPQKMEDKEFLQKFSRLVGSEVDRIDKIVKELLDFAKPSVPELKPANLTQLIDDTLELVSNNFVRYKVNVEKNFTTDGCVLNVDKHQIKQVLLNLFMNAAEAMRDNGGELSVRTYIDKDANRFCCVVEDTGVGISAGDLKHIFDPFFTKKDGGTGLGLAICQGIISEHGGKITVKSKINKGTHFIIELPMLNN